ncbi:MAG: group III truncated hemoglobin [Sphingobacteriales bacterium]|nr:MAG: group III truncated hemoglobin [Sphingobacteriales bacterium]
MNAIQTREDIDHLLALFYSRIRTEPVIGPIFNATIPDDHWPGHLSIIGDFWETILLHAARYKRAPIPPHIRLDKIFPLEPDHFNRWVGLFHQTVDELYAGEVAEEAKKRASLMAKLIAFKVQAARTNGFVQ